MEIKKFFTVIVIKTDLFESVIVDERHFANIDEAENFKNGIGAGLVGVIAEI